MAVRMFLDMFVVMMVRTTMMSSIGVSVQNGQDN